MWPWNKKEESKPPTLGVEEISAAKLAEVMESMKSKIAEEIKRLKNGEKDTYFEIKAISGRTKIFDGPYFYTEYEHKIVVNRIDSYDVEIVKHHAKIVPLTTEVFSINRSAYESIDKEFEDEEE